MKKTTVTALASTVLMAALLADAGIDRGGINVGSLLENGTVTVNGIQYDASNSVVTVGGSQSDSSVLQSGQIVTVYGYVEPGRSDGIADQIAFDVDVSGLVEEMDPWADDGWLIVMGQRVRITADTNFDPSIVPASVFGLDVGMQIQVSGMPGENDGIDATWIGVQSPGSRLEVTASVKNVDSSKKEFTINDLEVKYRNAERVGFLDGHPVDYDRVHVWGWDLDDDGRLLAAYVEKKPPLIGPPESAAYIDAIVTLFDSYDYFELGGVAASLDSQTNFDGGNASHIAIGVRLRIDGHFNDDGIIVAESVEFID